jgi:hypothetical protein
VNSNSNNNDVGTSVQTPAQYMEILARLMVRTHCESQQGTVPEDFQRLSEDADYVNGLGSSGLEAFLKLADSHHVLVRVLTALQSAATALKQEHLAVWCEGYLARDQARIKHSIEALNAVCNALESRGCQATVIKSLDHWPDLGSDLDLYTTAPQAAVNQVLEKEFDASTVERSWGDRLANKWNYRVPGLPELIEIHVQYLGQTGEHAEMARRVVERRVRKQVAGFEFHVPAPEERIIISTLQRVYRHFSYRLCDMIDVAVLMQKEAVDFAELRRAADLAGIWPGVSTFLFLIRRYLATYGGDLSLPREVLEAAHSRGTGVHFSEGFLRVSKVTGAELYASQLLQAGKHRDVRALVRLPLLPPLAISAAVAHSVTGNDKGIW